MHEITMNPVPLYRWLILGLFAIFASGCQPKVYLMPSPLSVIAGGDIFHLTPESHDENLIGTLYATNRLPMDGSNRDGHYTIFPSNTLRLGYTIFRIGEEEMSWEEIHRLSLLPERKDELLLKQEFTREVTSYKLKDLKEKTAGAEGFFDQVNQLLRENFDKDILVYVHGANSNFYRATAQGAQLHYFTGQNSLTLTFSWPSAESLLKYKTDVRHAQQTIPAFTKLLELLAENTIAQHINILAYSAGAQIVAPGLAALSYEFPELSQAALKKKLRIGEVYFAAPDSAYKDFIGQYLQFSDIVERVTINMNREDMVLLLSTFQNNESRLCRPDFAELNTEEDNLAIALTQTRALNILDLGESKPLQIGRVHDSWYGHPWVSSDLLLLLLYNAAPLERGLIEHWDEYGSKTYRFPEDYKQTLQEILGAHEDALSRQSEAVIE
jgi:esterase/lipase superfamily enzyme